MLSPPDDGLGTCRFEGYLDGTAARSFRGTVEQAGTTSYLLLGVRAGIEDWVLDVEGIDGPGERDVRILLVSPAGVVYRGRQRSNVRTVEGQCAAEGLCLALAGTDGSVAVLAGRLGWPRLGGVPREVDGHLVAELGVAGVVPIPACMRLRDDRWQVWANLGLGEGESAMVTLEVPGLDEGAWEADQMALDVVITRVDDRGDLEIRQYACQSVRARAEVFGDQYLLRFHGALRQRNGLSQMVHGRFSGTIRR
jgi:hypothetical protein